MCCKLLGIEEFKKPRLTWCHLVQIGKGCGDYENRPPTCRNFECVWLQSPHLPDDERPDGTGVVAFIPERERSLQVHVDPHKPDAWRRGITGRFIHRASAELPVLVTIGDRRKAVGTEDVLRDLEIRKGIDILGGTKDADDQ